MSISNVCYEKTVYYIIDLIHRQNLNFKLVFKFTYLKKYFFTSVF